jgi:hypothetical protein
MLTENDVVEAVGHFLTDNGFRLVQQLTTSQIGDDLVVEQGQTGVRLSIEAKGETSARSTSARFGRGFDSAQVSVHVAEAVFKSIAVLSRTDRAWCAGIALPDTPFHSKRISLVRPVLERLGVLLFWVRADMSVRCEGPLRIHPNQALQPSRTEGARG